MMKKTIQIISFVLLLIYVAAVGFLCLMEPDNIPSVTFDLFGLPVDKVAHFTMFFPYPILVWFSINHERLRSRGKQALMLAGILVLGAGLAILTEYLQKLTGYRTFDLNDFYADLIGMGLCGLILLAGILFKHQTSKKKVYPCSEK